MIDVQTHKLGTSPLPGDDWKLRQNSNYSIRDAAKESNHLQPNLHPDSPQQGQRDNPGQEPGKADNWHGESGFDAQCLMPVDVANLSLTHSGAIPEGRVVGVYFDKQRRIWRANWREGGVGKRKTKNFSVDDFGFEEARRMAIQYRLIKMMEASERTNAAATYMKSPWSPDDISRKPERGAESCGSPQSMKGKKRRRYTHDEHQAFDRIKRKNERLAAGLPPDFIFTDEDYASGAAGSGFYPPPPPPPPPPIPWEYPLIDYSGGPPNTAPTPDTVDHFHHVPTWSEVPPLVTPTGDPFAAMPPDVALGVPSESYLVVTSSPLTCDDVHQSSLLRIADLTSTADTASDDELLTHPLDLTQGQITPKQTKLLENVKGA